MSTLEELVERFVPMGRWAPLDIGPLGARLVVDPRSAGNVLRHRMGLAAVREPDTLRVDEWRGHTIGRIYRLGYDGVSTRVLWRRWPAGVSPAEVARLARLEVAVTVRLVDGAAPPAPHAAPPAPRAPRAPRAPSAQVPLLAAAPAPADDAALLAALLAARQRLDAAQSAWDALEAQRAARVAELRQAMDRLSVLEVGR